MTLSKLNQLTKPRFIEQLGTIYEHSPWVSEFAFESIPFTDREHLIDTFKTTVENATDEAKLTLVRAHPDLGGKLARAGKLTAESTAEQAGLGLDRLGDEEYGQFATHNANYLKKFGFPFIICAKLNTREQVLAAFSARLQHTREEELTESLRQIHLIARLRIEEKIAA